jgi:hypothetical protein
MLTILKIKGKPLSCDERSVVKKIDLKKVV